MRDKYPSAKPPGHQEHGEALVSTGIPTSTAPQPKTVTPVTHPQASLNTPPRPNPHQSAHTKPTFCTAKTPVLNTQPQRSPTMSVPSQDPPRYRSSAHTKPPTTHTTPDTQRAPHPEGRRSPSWLYSLDAPEAPSSSLRPSRPRQRLRGPLEGNKSLHGPTRRLQGRLKL